MSLTPASVANRDIDSTLRENRVFPPPPEFSAKAYIKSLDEYEALYKQSIDDPEKFWAGVARDLHWFKPWDKVLDWNLPWAKWFVGGKLNLSYNCVDRHALGERAQKTALIWEGEPGEIRRLTYAELHAEVQKFANALKSLGIQKGDRVAIYMGMTPELAIALLACARIGAVHSVIFGGFAANAIADRVDDSGCVAIITQDTSYRRGNEIKLKATVDEAMPACPTVKHVVVYKRTGSPVNMVAGRDHWWHDLVAKAAPDCPAEPMDSEDPLYILYTSGITGKPKGLLHTTGGYAVQTYLTSQIRLRPARRRRLLVHGRHRLGHRPLLRRLRPAAKRRHRPHVRRRAQLPRLLALLEDRRRPPGHHLLHRAHRHPRLHQVGRRVRRQIRSRARSACSAPSASPSTPKPGCGIARRSAATAAPSSTPGGRPRPAPS